MDEDSIVEAKYAMVALMDETVLSVPGGVQRLLDFAAHAT